MLEWLGLRDASTAIVPVHICSHIYWTHVTLWLFGRQKVILNFDLYKKIIMPSIKPSAYCLGSARSPPRWPSWSSTCPPSCTTQRGWCWWSRSKFPEPCTVQYPVECNSQQWRVNHLRLDTHIHMYRCVPGRRYTCIYMHLQGMFIETSDGTEYVSFIHAQGTSVTCCRHLSEPSAMVKTPSW